MSSELERAFTPALDVVTELLVAGVVERDLLSAKAAERPEHLGEDRGREATILLGGELAESVEPVARLDRHQIDEVPGGDPDGVRVNLYAALA